MFLNSKDYDTTALFIAALKAYNAEEGDQYVAKVKYNLDRDCDATDYFINLLQLQKSDEYLDTYPYPGFEDYDPPAPTFNITYINGFATQYASGAPTTYQPGVTSIAITTQPLNSNIILNQVNVVLDFGGTEFTETSGTDGEADFSFTAPASLSGDVVVTSSLADAASNAVAFGFHGEVIDTEVYDLVDNAQYGSLRIVNGNVGVGDKNGDGTVNTADLTSALSEQGDDGVRLKFSKHASVTLGTLYYYQGLDGTISYTITPSDEDYTWGTSNANTGAVKGIDSLKWNIAVRDSDGLPVTSVTTVNGSSLSLNSDNSYTGTIAVDSDFNSGLLAIFTLLKATNDATLSSQVHAGVTTSITAGDKFQPGDDITVTIADDTTSDANVDGSLLKVKGYDNANLTGAAVVAANSTALSNNAGTVTLPVPSTYDKDLYLSAGYAVYKVNNLISEENLSDSPLDVATYISTSVDTTYYTSGSQTVTITVTMEGSYVRSDYELSISAQQTTGGTSVIATGNTADSSFTFNVDDDGLTGTESIVIKYSLADAD